MGKFKRIAMKDIKAMQKTLDDLPTRTLAKQGEEPLSDLAPQIRKALEKGYTVRELSEIMADGNVSIPPPVIRARLLPKGETTRKRSSPSKRGIRLLPGQTPLRHRQRRLPHLRRQRQSRHRYQQSLYRRHQSPQKHQLSLHRSHQSLLHQIIYLQRHRLQVKHQIIHLQ